MAQSKNYLEPRYTMEQARFVPDPHASTLLPHEFDGGTNIYADKRGIRKVLGEVPVLSDIPGTPIAIFGGYRTSSNFEFVSSYCGRDTGTGLTTYGDIYYILLVVLLSQAIP